MNSRQYKALGQIIEIMEDLDNNAYDDSDRYIGLEIDAVLDQLYVDYEPFRKWVGEQ